MAKKWLEEYDQKLQESKPAVYADTQTEAMLTSKTYVDGKYILPQSSCRRSPKNDHKRIWHLARTEEIVQNQKKLGACPEIGVCCDI